MIRRNDVRILEIGLKFSVGYVNIHILINFAILYFMNVIFYLNTENVRIYFSIIIMNYKNIDMLLENFISTTVNLRKFNNMFQNFLTVTMSFFNNICKGQLC